MIKVVLFDLDGVLVDACDWHYEALNNALQKFAGFKISREEHETVYNGLPTRTKLQKLLNEGRIVPWQMNDVWNAKQKYTKETINQYAKEDGAKLRAALALSLLSLRMQLKLLLRILRKQLRNAMDLDNFINLYSRHDKSLLGFSVNPITKRSVAVGRGDVLFIDWVLSQNPQWTNAVELGTWIGITSLYIGMAMRMRGGELHTFDVGDNREDAAKRGWLDNMHFHQEDILDSQNPNQNVINLMSQDNLFAFVDNGNKVKEVEMYCQYMKSGSGFITHDWNVEIRITDIQHILTQFNFVSEYEHIAGTLNSHCRFWRKA